MKFINGTTDFKLYNTCIAMGKFDGMHMGHQYLFHELMKYKEKGLTSVIFTFDFHPYNFFSDKKIPLIYTEEEKKLLLLQYEPDVFLSYPFTRETSLMEPEDFIIDVLIKRLGVKIIVIGKDFKFGRKRRGDADMLNKFAKTYGYEVIVYEKFKLNNSIISSSLIRNELVNGNMMLVNELLGNPFTIVGKVVHGKQIGRKLGIPTINLIPDTNKLLPPNGVYYSVTKIGDKMYNGISNIGINPTISDEMQRGVETYIFDFDEEIYGKNVILEIHNFIRNEKKFLSTTELMAQINLDIEEVKALSNNNLTNPKKNFTN